MIRLTKGLRGGRKSAITSRPPGFSTRCPAAGLGDRLGRGVDALDTASGSSREGGAPGQVARAATDVEYAVAVRRTALVHQVVVDAAATTSEAEGGGERVEPGLPKRAAYVG
jgi:hypothetical protein